MFLSLWLYSPLLHLDKFSVSSSFYTVGMTPWTSGQPVSRPLPAHMTIHTQNKRKHTSMPQVGFEPMIPEFEQAKTVHVLDRVATVIDYNAMFTRIYNITLWPAITTTVIFNKIIEFVPWVLKCLVSMLVYFPLPHCYELFWNLLYITYYFALLSLKIYSIWW
jgi:hypothetical protein